MVREHQQRKLFSKAAVKSRSFIFAITILIILTLAYLFGWTNLFQVKSIEVIGAPDSTVTATVLKRSGVKLGEQMARVEPKEISNRLDSSNIDWLERVEISRNWLSGKLTIALKARTAVATVGGKLIDEQGFLFTSPISPKNLSQLPVLSAGDQQLRISAIELYQGLPDDLRKKVVGVNASSKENFQFELANGLKIMWGNSRDSSVKARIYKALIALPENKKIKLMDLSDPSKPSVI